MDETALPPVVPLIVSVPAYGLNAELLEPLRRRWAVVLSVALAFAASVLVWQAVAVPRYSAYAVIGAAETPGQGVKSTLSGLSGLASVAGVSLPGSSGQTSPFDQFKFLLTSFDLATFQIAQRPMLRIAFPGAWDPKLRRWREPEGIRVSIERSIDPLFGIPASPPIDARTLAGLYGSKLKIQTIPETELFRIVFDDPDPTRAAILLDYLLRDANELLRRRAQANARMQAAYLRNRLALVEVQSYRETLVALLQQQEQTLMLANGQLPYAAQLVEQINVSAVPTSKHPLLYATIAFVLGLCFGGFAVIIAHNRRRSGGVIVEP